jgi:hypothetical protein
MKTINWIRLMFFFFFIIQGIYYVNQDHPALAGLGTMLILFSIYPLSRIVEEDVRG